MNILKKASLWFLLFVFTIFSVNALVLEWDINLEEATTDSLRISWNPVDWAIGYFVYYDTQSHADDKNYSNTSDDMIEWTETTLENLESWITYYIALKVVDWDWNEWDFSDEFSFATEWAINNLSIDNIEVIDSNSVSVVFNNDIDPTKDIEFKIEEKNNDLNEISINDISVEWNTVNLVLGSELESNKDYTLTVVSLTWVNWETIDEWVDWVIDFNTWEITDLNSAEEENDDVTVSDGNWNSVTDDWENVTVTDENGNVVTTWDDDTSASDSNDGTTTTTDLNSAAPETTSWATTNWTNLSEEDIKKTAELAAKKSEKLPQTGPTEWLLFIAALILAFGVTKFRKQA